MIYVKAYLVALGRLLVISGAFFFAFRILDGTEWASVFLIYLSVTAAVAGPIQIMIGKTDAK